MNVLTPGFFDGLVLIVIIVGVVLAAWRIYGDFRRGPRWPDDSTTPTERLADLPEEPVGKTLDEENKP